MLKSAKKVSYETASESVIKKHFFHGTYETSVGEGIKLTRLQCKVCSKHISEVVESVESMPPLINYVDGLTYVHKSIVRRRVKSGSLDDWAKQKICSVVVLLNKTNYLFYIDCVKHFYKAQ